MRYKRTTRRQDLILINKKKLWSTECYRSGRPQNENKRKRKEQQLDLSGEIFKNAVKHEVDSDVNSN